MHQWNGLPDTVPLIFDAFVLLVVPDGTDVAFRAEPGFVVEFDTILPFPLPVIAVVRELLENPAGFPVGVEPWGKVALGGGGGGGGGDGDGDFGGGGGPVVLLGLVVGGVDVPTGTVALTLVPVVAELLPYEDVGVEVDPFTVLIEDGTAEATVLFIADPFALVTDVAGVCVIPVAVVPLALVAAVAFALFVPEVIVVLLEVALVFGVDVILAVVAVVIAPKVVMFVRTVLAVDAELLEEDAVVGLLVLALAVVPLVTEPETEAEVEMLIPVAAEAVAVRA